MDLGIDENKRVVCGMCGKIATHLVPLYDNDNNHKNTICCRPCKRYIKSGNQEPIVKFKRDAGVYTKIEQEFNTKAGKRTIVERI